MSAAALLKVVSGRITDRTGRRKPFVVAGYGLSSVAKPLIGAAAAWPWVAGFRFVDRLSKGLRTSPRDTLIADVSDDTTRGAAYVAFATAFLLFLILRRHSEGLAAGYVGVRGFENVFYVAGVVGLLIMVTVSQTDALGTAGAAGSFAGSAGQGPTRSACLTWIERTKAMHGELIGLQAIPLAGGPDWIPDGGCLGSWVGGLDCVDDCLDCLLTDGVLWDRHPFPAPILHSTRRGRWVPSGSGDRLDLHVVSAGTQILCRCLGLP